MNKDFKPYGAKLTYLSKLFKCNMKDESSKHGINSTYANIIMLLTKYPEGINQNDIAQEAHLAAPTVSLTLKQMETLNYIIRVPSEVDNRKTIVKLTSEGYDLDNQIRDCFKIIEDKMVQNISLEDLEHFEKILEMMKENLTKEGETKE
mgnify:CR=1 FL=1